MLTLLAPLQLGFGIRNGAEAAINAARMYLSNPDPSIAFLKLDFQNAFNSLQWDEMSETVQKLAPDLTAFPHIEFLLHSRRFGETRHFSRTRGCSRVTLWVPSSFACLSISSAPVCSLGVSKEDVLYHLNMVKCEGVELGLHLNQRSFVSTMILVMPSCLSSQELVW